MNLKQKTTLIYFVFISWSNSLHCKILNANLKSLEWWYSPIIPVLTYNPQEAEAGGLSSKLARTTL